MTPSYFKDMKVVDERLSYLEDVVKELANCIQIVNANYQTLSDIVKELLEAKKALAKEVQTDKGPSNRTAGRARRRNVSTDS